MGGGGRGWHWAAAGWHWATAGMAPARGGDGTGPHCARPALTGGCRVLGTVKRDARVTPGVLLGAKRGGRAGGRKMAEDGGACFSDCVDCAVGAQPADHLLPLAVSREP